MRKLIFLFLSPFLLLAKPLFVHSGTEHVTATTAIIPQPATTKQVRVSDNQEKAEELVHYALRLQGSPYVYAGITPEGFDCSGFVTHVFGHFGVQVPHSSAMQAEVGEQVKRQQARAGDLVIFTGTNPAVREPGHVGIVISEPGDTITFVHASSNGGVKVSQVEGSRYNLRFLELRRVL
ncbi:C40 family peptidase [Pontibacter chitinilyticus]|uniref:C40 family peptidase n=1 Tax=Pontibacter chitinilyticus TaxID=2674989 RepID=UPI00321AA033